MDLRANCGEDKDTRVIICHGNDLQTLVNQMTYCGLVDQFMQSFGRAKVVSNDALFDGKSKSLTKQELEENSHDADHDFKKVGKDTPDMSFNSNISTQARLRLLVGRQRTS